MNQGSMHEPLNPDELNGISGLEDKSTNLN